MHHPLIHAHRPRPVERPPGFDVGFLGTLTRRSFVAGMPGEFAPFDASTFTPDYPAFDEEYFEWIALLEAVAEAREQFVFIECGAGYGRWCVRAALAARHLNFHCTAVEAEPTHCHWIGEHLADNGIDPADHEIIWAALAARPGFVPFAIGRSDAWYGQAIRKRAPEPFPDARARRTLRMHSVSGLPPLASPATDTSMWILATTLMDLIAPYQRVDVIDLDVQGVEAAALAPAMKLLTDRVRRVHVGTHSRPIEADLRRMFLKHRWTPLADYPGFATASTPYGEIRFSDGAQTWLNPRVDKQ